MTDTGKVILLCSTVWLYSTGHWIGGTVSLVYLAASNFKWKK